MSKLNTGTATGPMQIASQPTGLTHQGGAGYRRDDKTELYLRATTMFAGEKAFYESGADHDQRSINLTRILAQGDWQWMSNFLPWLRKDANIRTMAIMLAAEAVDARLEFNLHPGRGELTSRQLINEVLQRPDEPGEMLQYWLVNHGKEIPKPIKRGIADAATRMYDQRAVLRWDGKGDAPVRFADVLELCHPRLRKLEIGTAETPQQIPDPNQSELFRHLITVRKQRDGYQPSFFLRQIRDRYDLSRMPARGRHALAGHALEGDRDAIKLIESASAGQWEWLISWLGETCTGALTKRQQWELIIPEMGYMALLRNLRNFDEAGLQDSLANKIANKIASPAEVKISRQLPFRFFSAYKAAPSLRWGHSLEKALQECVPNIPVLDGKTLVLIDMSGSMQAPMSSARDFRLNPKAPNRMEAAALFGIALALKNPDNTDVWGFADGQFKIDNISQGASILKTVKLITDQCGRVGHGTQIERAVRDTYKDHDRVCIFTDMQTMPSENAAIPYYGHIGDVSSAVPKNVHVYGFNLAGYENSGMATSPYRHEMGGLTDHTFALIPLLESGARGDWPWAA
jgi:hypothetical protein